MRASVDSSPGFVVKGSGKRDCGRKGKGYLLRIKRAGLCAYNLTQQRGEAGSVGLRGLGTAGRVWGRRGL
jgi:hypothetical protein